ncbi:MAG: 16S rRNA (cytidine(1402)-2'-O)-methyltransferase [Thermodesulfobacteriota bacterium]
MGTLWIVAVPLGNDRDLSPRAAEALGRAGLVLAEDTRRAGLLLSRLGIKAQGFLSLHDHNEEARIDRVLAALDQDADVALVSDAGTPLLSDPGYRLVRACRAAGRRVSPVPGPSALTAALSAGGLPPQPFAFLGFLPRKAGEARAVLENFGRTGCTLVLFERKDRVRKTLALAAAALGPREFCLARELTKPHEEFIVGRLDALDGLDFTELGEFTVVLGPAEAPLAASEDELDAVLREEAAAGGRPREVVRRVLARVTGWSSKAVYARLEAQGGPGRGR